MPSAEGFFEQKRPPSVGIFEIDIDEMLLDGRRNCIRPYGQLVQVMFERSWALEITTVTLLLIEVSCRR